MDLDPAIATVSVLTQAIRDRQVSSRELLDYLLVRAERLNPALNAIVAWDIDRARAAAVAADEATARGELAGPLHGLPMTVKDTFETEGLVTTSGAPELARYVPSDDAVAAARLKAAGAIIFGKSNTSMYAGDWQTCNDVYGRTDNPWDPSRTAGGSSGGSAAAGRGGLAFGARYRNQPGRRGRAPRLLDIDGAAVPHPVAAAWCLAIGSALLPVVTLPTGLNRAGLPVGVQVVGPFLSDLRCCGLPRSWTPRPAAPSSRHRPASPATCNVRPAGHPKGGPQVLCHPARRG